MISTSILFWSVVYSFFYNVDYLFIFFYIESICWMMIGLNNIDFTGAGFGHGPRFAAERVRRHGRRHAGHFI